MRVFGMTFSLTLTMDLELTVLLEIQAIRILPIVSHMRWSMFAVVSSREVLQADTIVVSCGLANFERTSWSTQRRHDFCGFSEELDTGADHDKFVRSSEDNYPEMCNGRSLWTIDFR